MKLNSPNSLNSQRAESAKTVSQKIVESRREVIVSAVSVLQAAVAAGCVSEAKAVMRLIWLLHRSFSLWLRNLLLTPHGYQEMERLIAEERAAVRRIQLVVNCLREVTRDEVVGAVVAGE